MAQLSSILGGKPGRPGRHAAGNPATAATPTKGTERQTRTSARRGWDRRRRMIVATRPGDDQDRDLEAGHTQGVGGYPARHLISETTGVAPAVDVASIADPESRAEP